MGESAAGVRRAEVKEVEGGEGLASRGPIGNFNGCRLQGT